MTRFHGWLAAQTDPGSHNAAEALEIEPPGGAAGQSAASADAPGGLRAVIAGYPRWSDARLSERAREAGHAAALLQAYEARGERLFEHLHGSFALAVIDARARTALLAVDRLGIERLCFAAVDGLFAFGSTVQAVTRHPQVGFELDPQGLFDYLYHHMIPAPRTVARGVRKLEAGHYVRWQQGRLSTARYWHCRFEDDVARFDERACAAELLERLEQVTREQRAGADAAAFLSGGIDSSTVVGMLARTSPGGVSSFTIGFEAEGYDEVSYARISARHFGAREHEYYVTPADVAAGVELIAAGFDEPFGNSSVVPSYYCALAARERGVSQLLAGDGGDELFGGNVRYARQNVFEWYFRVPAALRRGMLEPLARGGLAASLPPLRKLRSYIDQAHVPLPDRLQTYNYFSREAPESIVHPELLQRVNVQGPVEDLRRTFAEADTRDALNRMLYLDWKFTLADNDLRKVGAACSLAGVAVRFPWLDDRIVELSARVPGPYKVRGRRLRYFVKRALRDFVPRAVLEKPKHGFGLPFGVWMREDRTLQQLVGRSMASLRERRLIRPEYIDALLTRHRQEHAAYYGEFLWVLMMLELWLEKHAHR